MLFLVQLTPLPLRKEKDTRHGSWGPGEASHALGLLGTALAKVFPDSTHQQRVCSRERDIQNQNAPERNAAANILQARPCRASAVATLGLDILQSIG